MDLVSVKYYLEAPDAQKPQNSTDFRDESNGTSPGTWKQVKNIKKPGLANPNVYISHMVFSN